MYLQEINDIFLYFCHFGYDCYTTDVLMMRLSYRYICRAPLNIYAYFFCRRAVRAGVKATIYYYITF